MKLFSVLFSLFMSSMAFGQTQTLNQILRSPAPPIENMSTEQLTRHLGKTALRVTAYCSSSAWTVAAAAVAETLPFVADEAVEATERKFDSESDGSKDRNFHSNDEAHRQASQLGGSGSVATDLGKIAYYFLFTDNSQALSESLTMPLSKKSYSATKALAKRFYGDEEKGECRQAGRAMADLLTFLSTRR